MSDASKMLARIWVPNGDGYGAAYIRADLVEQMAAALREIAELSERGDNPIGFAAATAFAALQAYEAAQTTQGQS